MSTYVISGYVKSGGVGVSGATVTISGATAGSTTTDVDGYYGFGTCAVGENMLVPSKSTYGFAPNARVINLIEGGDADQGADQNFTMVSLTTTYDFQLCARGDDYWLDALNYNFKRFDKILGNDCFNGAKYGLKISKKDADEIYIYGGHLAIMSNHYYLNTSLTIKMSNPVASTVYYVYASETSSGDLLSASDITISSASPSYWSSYGGYYKIFQKFMSGTVADVGWVVIGILKTDASAEIDWVASDSYFNLDPDITDGQILVYQEDANAISYFDGYTVPDPLTLAKGGTAVSLAPTVNCVYGWDNTENAIVDMNLYGLSYDNSTVTLNSSRNLNKVVKTYYADQVLTSSVAGKTMRIDVPVGGCTVTLPAVPDDDGEEYTIVKISAHSLIVKANTGMYLGQNTTSGGSIINASSSELGAQISVRYVADLNGLQTWVIESITGTWYYI